MRWLLIPAGILAGLVLRRRRLFSSLPLDPEDDPTCPDEVDGCESWPTWFEGDAA